MGNGLKPACARERTIDIEIFCLLDGAAAAAARVQNCVSRRKAREIVYLMEMEQSFHII